MPKFGLSKEAIEGKPAMQAGVYDFRLDGFKPAYSKPKPGKDQSINLNPDLKVINHPTENDRKIFASMNEKFAPSIVDMVHSLGLPMVDRGDGGADIPGEFLGDADPKSWTYQGPLVGRTGKCELAQTQGTNGKPRSEVKRFICAVPGCQVKHSESLIGT